MFILHSPLRRYCACIAIVLSGLAAQGCTKAAPSEGSDGLPALAFTDVTEEAGLADFQHETGAFGQKWMPETLGAGGGFVDYDGDGWIDILLVAGGVWPERGSPIPALELYRNQADGTFANVTHETGLDDVSAYGFGIAAADFDGDGDEDIFLAALGENKLLRNDGGIFTEISEAAGLTGESEWSTAPLFFDADGDGHLDLYVANYVDWTPETDKWCTSDGDTKDYCTPHQYQGVPGRFYRNNRDGTFSERTAEAGLSGEPGKSLGVASLDFDGDGRLDFFVANDTRRNLLYRTRGDGTFEDVGVAIGVAYDVNGRARAGMGVDAAVLEGEHLPVIAVGNFSEETIGLFRSTAHGLFRDDAAVAGVGRPSFFSLTFGLFFFDADLDGHLDLLLANGHIMKDVETVSPSLVYRQPAQLFLGRGDGTFEQAELRGDDAFAQKLVGRGAAYADYDGDGDLDVLITENGGPAHLWRNETNPAERDSVHVLRVRLEASPPNPDAIGAKLVAVAAGARQERWIRTGSSYLSQSEKTATFGLGTADRVDTLRVYWPSGRVDVYEGLDVDQTLHLVEGRPLAPNSAPDGELRPAAATKDSAPVSRGLGHQ